MDLRNPLKKPFRDDSNSYLYIYGDFQECNNDNPTCAQHTREGKPFHYIPPQYSDDPGTLVLFRYHFVSEPAALSAYLNARKHASVVTTIEERDRAYSEQRSVWINLQTP